MCLTTGGRDPTGTIVEQLNSHANQNQVLGYQQVRKLTGLSIHTYGDLLEQREASSRWTDTGLLGLNFIDELLEARQPEHNPIALRAGAAWTMQEGTILEFIGWLAVADGPKLIHTQWRNV